MIIAVVGSGGKTTRIQRLAKRYRENGKRVLVTTTTHMFREEGCNLSGNLESIVKELEVSGYCMAGIPAENNKIKALPKEIYEMVCKYADVVLVEADGSKGLPAKYPAEHEPVIPENADEIQVVTGLSAIGKPVKEVCHRKELVEKCLSILEDTILEPEHLQKLLTEGYLIPLRKKYPDKTVRVCPGQQDSLYERTIAQFLAEEKDVSVLKNEWFRAKQKLVILGAGHVGSQVAHLGHFLDFEVTVIDDRPEFANKAVLPDADNVFCHEFETVEELFPKDKDTFYVVVTRGHAADKICVEKILKHDSYGYLGMIGSRLKVEKTLEILKQEGFEEEQLKEIHAPIGLKIGARTPQEIALSIAAELILEKNKCSGSTISGELLTTKEAGVLCVITEKTGSSPRGEGSMMLVTEKGILGSVGGGLLEQKAIEAAKEITTITSKKFLLSNEESAALGMICGGSNQILFVPLECEL